MEYRESLYVGYRYHQTAGMPGGIPVWLWPELYQLRIQRPQGRPGGRHPHGDQHRAAWQARRSRSSIVAKPDAKIFRPAQELKGFAKSLPEAR